jgi:hypothetical protein
MGARLGIGVTADSVADAVALIKQRLCSGAVLPEAFEYEEVKSADMLDEKHVVPNMGNMLRRGIWSPLGHD